MNKKLFKKVVVILCVSSVLISSFSIAAIAAENSFVKIVVSGFRDDGTEVLSKNNVFYLEDEVLYAPLSFFETYTLYEYDIENNAFVRTGQEFKKAYSKIVLDYENSQVNVFYSRVHKEVYDIKIHQFSDIYFFPVDEMLAYLKASVTHNDDETMSVLVSGFSVVDALYDFSIYASGLDAVTITDDLFAGEDDLVALYTICGYVKNTIFDFKISNLVPKWGDYEKCYDLLEKAVTNTDVYNALYNENELLQFFGETSEAIYSELYKEVENVSKLVTKAAITNYEEYKDTEFLSEDSPFTNIFVSNQSQVDEIKKHSDKMKKFGEVVETLEYVNKFYSINSDNRNAIPVIAKCMKTGEVARAITKIQGEYGKDLLVGRAVTVGDKFVKDVIESFLESKVSSVMKGANKVKLATGIVKSAFKFMGVDLTDNSAYEVFVADDIASAIICNSEIIGSERYETLEDSENMRLTMIMLLLIEIEGYNAGNVVARTIDKRDAKFYNDEINELNERLVLLYRASESRAYDSVEGIQKVIDQNRKQLSAFKEFNKIDETTANSFFVSQGPWKKAAIELIYNFPKYGFMTNDTAQGLELVDIDCNGVPEVIKCDYYGATGIPGIDSIYAFNGTAYAECELEFIDEANSEFPVLPKKNSKGELYFLSSFKDNSSVAEDELPLFSSFWYSGATGVSFYKMSGNTVTVEKLIDFSDLVSNIQRTRVNEETKLEATEYWKEYQKKVRGFNAEYKDAGEKCVCDSMWVDFFVPDSSESERMQMYRAVVSKEKAEAFVEAYITADAAEWVDIF